MEWTPYTGPVVPLDEPHFHNWILGERTSNFGGQPWTSLVYSATLRPYHNRMTARNHAKPFMDPAYGKAGVMVLKCDGNPATCPTWAQHNAANRDNPPGIEDGSIDLALVAFERSGAKALLDAWADENMAAPNES